MNFQNSSLHKGNNAVEIVHGNDLVTLLRNEMQVINRNAGTRMLLEKALSIDSLRAAQQRNRSSGHMRAHPLPHLDVVFAEIALGNSLMIPIDPIGVSKMDSGDAGILGRCAA